MFGLSVRFTCKDTDSAQAFDKLVAETVTQITQHEPGTLVYAVHTVEGQPLQRIFYELYTDQAAFEAHEAAPHTRHYLAAREEFLVSTEVDRLTLLTGTGLTGTGAGQGGGTDTGTGAGASGSAGAPSVTITCTSTANGHSGSGPAGPGSSGPGMAGPGPGSPGGPGAGAAG